jgi:hypothetical protein
MKAIGVGVCLLIASCGARAFAASQLLMLILYLALLAFWRRSIDTLGHPRHR